MERRLVPLDRGGELAIGAADGARGGGDVVVARPLAAVAACVVAAGAGEGVVAAESRGAVGDWRVGRGAGDGRIGTQRRGVDRNLRRDAGRCERDGSRCRS